jgi:hypothetical protein
MKMATTFSYVFYEARRNDEKVVSRTETISKFKRKYMLTA